VQKNPNAAEPSRSLSYLWFAQNVKTRSAPSIEQRVALRPFLHCRTRDPELGNYPASSMSRQYMNEKRSWMGLSVRSVAALLLISLSSAMAEEISESPAAERWAPQRCIRATQISDTEVLNNRMILFYMHGGEIYLNRLPGRCPGLTNFSGFSYFPVTAHRLCNLDFIGLRRFTGGDFSPTSTTGCGLGLFRPIREELVVWLKDWQRARKAGASE